MENLEIRLFQIRFQGGYVYDGDIEAIHNDIPQLSNYQKLLIQKEGNFVKNYNHDHKHSGGIISGTNAESITVGQLRDALAEFPDDAEVFFGGAEEGHLMFYRFKTRGPKMLQMEFNLEPYEE